MTAILPGTAGKVRAPSPKTLQTVYRRLMPLLVICYIMSFLDRTNIGMAKDRLEIDVGISAAAYGIGAGIFFLTYAGFEIPSNLILRRVGARFWITRIMITWGLISAAMAFVDGPISFYVLRALLGAAEAGLYPGVIYFLTLWFPAAERARAQGVFLLGACIASVIGAPLSGALLQLDGVAGLYGWQWMFIIEGLPSVLLAAVVWKVLPDRPTQASWLAPDTANNLEAYIREEKARGAEESGNHDFRSALKDPQLIFVMVLYFVNQISVYSLAYFLPSIIGNSWELSSFQIGMLTSIPWILAAIGVILVPRFARDQGNVKIWIIISFIGVACGLFLAAAGSPLLSYLGFCLVGLWFFAPQPLLFAHSGARMGGGALAAGLALINTFGLLGGFMAPNIMGGVEAATGNPLAGIWVIAIATLLAAGLAFLLVQPRALTRIVTQPVGRAAD